MDSEALFASALERVQSGAQQLLLEDVPEVEKAGGVTTRASSKGQLAGDQSPGPDVPGTLVGFPANYTSHKRIPGTRFVVDGFRVAGPWSHSYFLTHFHSDHYQGITENWRKGVIFCSEITARMVVQVLEVPEHFVVALPMDQEVEIDGCGVTLIDANHCPGAIQFLFRIPGEPEKRYVHCGDMRFCRDMTASPCLAKFVGADAVYLDTTYCNPRYVFPPQEESVEYVAATVAARMKEWEAEYRTWQQKQGASRSGQETEQILGAPANRELSAAPAERTNSSVEDPDKSTGIDTSATAEAANTERANEIEQAREQIEGPGEERQLGFPSWEGETLLEQALKRPVDQTDCPRPPLFIIATYVIGKEKILYAVAHRCRCKIFVEARKIKILHCLGLKDLSIFTTDPSRSNVHVVGWGFLGDAWPFFRSNFSNMEQALVERGYEEAVGFVPTGWTYELKKKSFPTREKGRCKIHLVPYSEHSNYAELREYVSFLKPKQIIPTVGVDEKGMDGKAVAAMRKHFRNLVDETEGKRRFLRSFQRSGSGSKREQLEAAKEIVPDTSLDEEDASRILVNLKSASPDGKDTCHEDIGQNGIDESGEDTDLDEEAQVKDDPDYVGSENEPESQDAELDSNRTGKRRAVKQGLKLATVKKEGESTSGGTVGGLEEPPARRLTPFLNRRGKRKINTEKDDKVSQKRPTLDLRPKLKEEGVEKSEQDVEAEVTDVKPNSGETLSWLQAHRQALQTAAVVPKSPNEKVDSVDLKVDAEEKVRGLEDQKQSNESGEKVAQLMAILPGVSAQRAGLLLARAGGDVAGALTWFYDGGGEQEIHAEGVANGGVEGETEPERTENGEEKREAESGKVGEDLAASERQAAIAEEEQTASGYGRNHEESQGVKVGDLDVGAAGMDVDVDENDVTPACTPEQKEDRADRTAEASTSGRVGATSKQGTGGLRSPPRTPPSKKGSQAAGKKRASVAKNGGGASKRGKSDRQQPSILSFFGGGKKEPDRGKEQIMAEKNSVPSGKQETNEKTSLQVKREADSSRVDAKVEQLMAVLEGVLSIADAEGLLQQARGDVSAAVDAFYSRHVSESEQNTKAATLQQDGVEKQCELRGEEVLKHPKEELDTLLAGNLRESGEDREHRNPNGETVEEADPHVEVSPKSSLAVSVEGEAYKDGGDQNGTIGKTEAGTQNSSESKPENHSVEEHASTQEEPKEEKLEGSGQVNVSSKDQKASAKEEPKERQLGGVVATGKLAASESDRTAVTLPLAKYNPIRHACWKQGEAAPYLHLSRTFEILERERGRLKMADILCNMFRSLLALSPADILPAVYLATNRIAPDFEKVDMSIGGSTVGAAIAEATGTSKAQMRELYNSLGDLGDVALACKQKQSTLMAPPPLRVAQVYGALRKISKETGPGCNNRKKNIVLGLLRACREKETQFVVRTLVLNMRIGAMMKTVLPALAQAVVIHKALPSDQPAGLAINGLKAKLQEASAAVVEAYNFCPNLDVLVPTLVEGGIEAVIAQGAVALGTPIKPMLAKITNGIPEILKRFQGQAFTAEFKYDGQRAQIHLLPDGTVRIFSRNLDDNTGKFPDVIETVKHAAQGGCASFIIDAELVAVDRSNGNKLMAFQTLSTRARGGEKTKIEVADVKIAVCVFAFDLLYVDGHALVKESFRERRRRMKEAFPKHSDGHFEFAREATVEEAEADAESEATSSLLQNFLQEAFAASCEGMMVKALDKDAGYAASKRSDSWLKVKKDYIEGLNDSLDLVPIGAWYGQGRKVGWFSPFLLACYDPEREEYQSVCRVMSGFTDVFYKETSALYREQRQLDQKPPYYRTLEQPDVWFSPHDVWEIRGADLTVSPVHAAAAGLVHPTRGISMRFPRMIKTRPDKRPEDATPPSYIADLFHRQTRKLDLAPLEGKENKKSAPEEINRAAEESGEESGDEEKRPTEVPSLGLED